MPSRLIVAIAACVLGVGCGAQSESGSDTLRVFAAASLTDAFADIEVAFERQRPDIDVQLNIAGSSRLREQILEGAPADVFVSADVANMDALASAGLLAESPVVLARNSLTIAVPSGNTAGVVGVESFTDDDLLLGACAPGVPCGELAREMFDAAGVDAALDTEEPNVRSLLTKVLSGDLDAGVVYITDVSADPTALDYIEIPPNVNVTTEYPIAVLVDASNPDAGRAFVEFVLSSQAQSMLADRGFAAP